MSQTIRGIWLRSIKYKMGIQNSNINALNRVYSRYPKNKNENYVSFLEKSETAKITNKNLKEVNGNLIKSPTEYYIVSKIEKYYKFKSGINYEFIWIRKFGNNKMLKSCK